MLISCYAFGATLLGCDKAPRQTINFPPIRPKQISPPIEERPRTMEEVYGPVTLTPEEKKWIAEAKHIPVKQPNRNAPPVRESDENISAVLQPAQDQALIPIDLVDAAGDYRLLPCSYVDRMVADARQFEKESAQRDKEAGITDPHQVHTTIASASVHVDIDGTVVLTYLGYAASDKGQLSSEGRVDIQAAGDVFKGTVQKVGDKFFLRATGRTGIELRAVKDL